MKEKDLNILGLKNYFIKQIKKSGALFFLLWICLLTGCVSSGHEPQFLITELPEAVLDGVYHKVGSGETLWRIAKTYDVPISDIIKSNNIPNVAQVERDQLVFIPGAEYVKDIPVASDDVSNEFAWPVKGRVLAYFNQSREKRNDGIDIAVKEGTVVHAARMGRVVFADFLAGYGDMVVLDHQDGFYSIYAQNSELLVKLGELVLKNEEIARIGKKNNRCFLHFEIRKDDVADNPLYYLP